MRDFLNSNDVQDIVAQFDAREGDLHASIFGETPGYVTPRINRNSPQYQKNLLGFAKFYGEVLEGTRPLIQLKEALSVSDLPLYFGDTLQRLLLADFAMRPPSWESYTDVNDQIPDFRAIKLKQLNGADGPLSVVDASAAGAVVGAQSEYPEAQPTDDETSYRVYKRGRIIPVEWEALVNDDLGALRKMPQKLSRACQRTETRFVAELLADTSGPNATYFTTARGNRLTSNPNLSIPNIAAAYTLLAKQTDTSGEPIMVDAPILLVPPALKILATNMKEMVTTDFNAAAAGGDSNSVIRVRNWIMAGIEVVVNEYLPTIASSANGHTQWYLIQKPADGRPLIQVGFLRGRRQPQLLMKAANQVSLDGSALSPMEGDFETDTARWKVRHVMGGSQVEYRSGVASNGSNS
jgi:hypothetical protein